MRHRLACWGLLLFTVPVRSAIAADLCPGLADFWKLREIAMHEPLVAEPHPDGVRLAFGGLSQYQYARSTGTRFGADLDVGAELPLFGCAKGGFANRPTKGQYRVGAYIPVSFHMLWDLRDPSLPIINNDYRFSYGMLKGIYGTGGTGIMPSHFEARWRIYAHESTHLGDELTIAAQDSVLRTGARFERVNVSYEFYEVSLGARWEDWFDDGSIALRAGWTRQIHSNGFYGDSITVTERIGLNTLAIRSIPVSPSALRTEPFVRTELRVGQLLVGADATRRIVLNYARIDPNAREEQRWSYNVILGLQDPERRFGERGKVDLYLRYYNGVNPHGQFRSQPRFRIFAIAAFLPV
jgi:hypothetical protein